MSVTCKRVLGSQPSFGVWCVPRYWDPRLKYLDRARRPALTDGGRRVPDDDDDAREVAVRVLIARGAVMLHLGIPCAWISFGAEGARELARLLESHAALVDGSAAAERIN